MDLIDYLILEISREDKQLSLINVIKSDETSDEMIDHLYYELAGDIDDSLSLFRTAKQMSQKQVADIKSKFSQYKKYPLLVEILSNKNSFGLVSVDEILRGLSLKPIKDLLGDAFYNALAGVKTGIKANVGPCELMFATIFTDVQMNNESSGDLWIKGVATELKRHEFVPWSLGNSSVTPDKLRFYKTLQNEFDKMGEVMVQFRMAHTKWEKECKNLRNFLIKENRLSEFCNNLINNSFINLNKSHVLWGAEMIENDFTPENICKVIACIALFNYKKETGFEQLLYAGGIKKNVSNKVVLLTPEDFKTLDSLWDSIKDFDATNWAQDNFYKTPKLVLVR